MSVSSVSRRQFLGIASAAGAVTVTGWPAHTAALSAEPRAEQCGWVQDRFGVSWQIVPQALFEMLQHPDTQRRNRVMAAPTAMKKIDLAGLHKAFAPA